jgi:hypothetical protein
MGFIVISCSQALAQEIFLSSPTPTPTPPESILLTPLEMRMPSLQVGDCLEVEGEADFYLLWGEGNKYWGKVAGEVEAASNVLVYDASRSIFVLLVRNKGGEEGYIEWSRLNKCLGETVSA